ncbi:GTPase required for pre-60S ribosomal subunit nuclear export and maturation [Cladochytrium tenue]|nr:GTPase required for pre-60S ribosomal subunit nuclear export and maturation [Cladochytrium tenue]
MSKGKKGDAATAAAVPASMRNATHVRGTNFYRDAAKMRQVNMLRGGRPVRDAAGKVVKAAAFQSRLAPGTRARVEPNRKWFENTRVVGQKELEKFREAMAEKMNDPYTVLLRQNKLPMSLVTDVTKAAQVNLLEVDSFSNTFGPKAQRNRPKLKASSIDELASSSQSAQEQYSSEKDSSLLTNMSFSGETDMARDPVFSKGQSKRIWNELYKVIDSSDVVIHVLDARDPLGTRCRVVESHIKKEASHKHLIFVINKCDLVPTWVTARWVKVLSREYPTLAFHASITNPFGKGSLIQLLRQFANLHSDKKQISVGFVGYPNTGKSSIINTLKNKKVCNVAPIPGETKIWQYITLMNRIYLIDCPGIVPPSNTDSESSIVLKGVVRVENVIDPTDHIEVLLSRVKPEYIKKTYEVEEWEDHMDFLAKLAQKSGRLLKKAEPDVSTVAKMVLNDWLRGRIPYFALPPDEDGDAFDDDSKEEAMDATHVSVPQQLEKIHVSANFLPEDAGEAPELKEDAADTQAQPDAKSKRRKDDDVDWDELLGSVVGKVVPAPPGSGDVVPPPNPTASTDAHTSAPAEDDDVDSASASGSSGEDDDDGDSDSNGEEEAAAPAKTRMTTNKRKVGHNFYNEANVKNRRRGTGGGGGGAGKRKQTGSQKALVRQLRTAGTFRVGSRKK